MQTQNIRSIVQRWLRGYFAVAGALFAASIVVGFLLGTQVPVEWLQGAGGESPFFPVALLGAVSLGLFSGFILGINGLLVGAVVQIALRETSALTVFMLIAPHGIIEIPAILLVAAIGFRCGHRTGDQRSGPALRCCRGDDRRRGLHRSRTDTPVG